MTKRDLPWIMSAGRALLGPLLVVGARCGWNGSALVGIVVCALLSDIFDGVLARRWSCDTAAVRLGDSMADMVFYVFAAIALWIAEPQVWRNNGVPLVALVTIEVSRFSLEFWKFGKPASYHSWMAKSWGLVLATAVIAAFAGGSWPWLMKAGLWLGVLSNLEGFAMSLVMPVWQKDVKSLLAAWRLSHHLAIRPAPQSTCPSALPTQAR